MVLAGVYSFIGVIITDDGLWFSIADDRQPSKGFLRRWLKKHVEHGATDKVGRLYYPLLQQ
jgi:hypothetical protein